SLAPRDSRDEMKVASRERFTRDPAEIRNMSSPTHDPRGDAPVRPGDQAPRSFAVELRISVPLHHLLYLPPEYDPAGNERWPLLLFLHGAGERGQDLEKLKAHGPPKLIASGRHLPFVVVSPQCAGYPDGWWDPRALSALLDDVIARFLIDEERIYVTGMSMGGFGTWALACAYPERFAAAVPICVGGHPKRVSAMRGIPTWVFHGEADPIVPLWRSSELVDALRLAGGNVRFTV